VPCTESRRPAHPAARRAWLVAGLLCCLAWPHPATAEGPLPRAAVPVLPAPAAARDWDEFRLQAAQRLMAANPDMTYTGPVLDPLLAIPVLEVDLDREGRVRNIRIVRVPSQAEDTTQMAIEAVLRAAPYGDMSRLPKPWKWVEVFLFDEDRRFKPRTLDN
jgi:protein TonB